MGPYSCIHLKRGRKRAPPRRSETSSSLALAMGMPDSSSLDSIRAMEVSQSGLTHETPALLPGDLSFDGGVSLPREKEITLERLEESRRDEVRFRGE